MEQLDAFKEILVYFEKFTATNADFLKEIGRKSPKASNGNAIKRTFNYISECSKKLLNNPSLHMNETAEDVFTSLKSLKFMISTLKDIDFESMFSASSLANLYMVELLEQLSNPGIATIQIGGKTLILKDLASVPLAVFYEAVLKHNALNEQEKDMEPFYRRIAALAVSGGISVDILSNVPGFVYQAAHFHSIGLPLEETGTLQSGTIAEANYRLMREHLKKFKVSEADLRLIFVDPLIFAFFREENMPWQIKSELYLQEILNLDVKRIADIAVLCPRFDLPVFFGEFGIESFTEGHRHKDSTKIGATLSISCTKQAIQFQSAGIDPKLARSFGMLIGADKVQLLVCCPVIKEFEGGRSDIHTVISMDTHWFLDLDMNSKNLECRDSCCTTSEIVDPAEEFTVDLDRIAGTDLNEHLNIDINFELDLHSGHAMEVDPASSDSDLEVPVGLNKVAYSKIVAFFENSVKPYLRKIDSEPVNPNIRRDEKLNDLSIKYIPGPTSGTDSVTPYTDRLSNMASIDLDRVKKNLTPIFTKQKTVSEMNVYKKHLADFFMFPKLYDHEVVDKKSALLTFEEMLPLMGGGPFGAFSRKCFCPGVVRFETLDQLLLDAATFAIHILYGLHVLHTKIGFVHRDISPENVMFSQLDGIWKLNDFGAALPLDQSLQTVREFQTHTYISPETLKTGICTKEADVYALGKVLMSTWLIQLMFLLEFGSVGTATESTYNGFLAIVRKMTHTDPKKRATTLQAMRNMNTFIEENLLENFSILGSKSIMNNVRYVLEEEDAALLESSDVPTREIITENAVAL